MDITTSKFTKDANDSSSVLIKIPKALLQWADMDYLTEVVVRAEFQHLVIEPFTEDNELMEMYAEEFVSSHHALLKQLVEEDLDVT